MKYLIAGKNGQLAAAFIRRLSEKSINYLAPEESEFDITDPAKVAEVVSFYKPDVIINCAAYNLVDKAEEEAGKAQKVNVDGPRLLARASKKHNAKFVHFGTDYVFDGAKEDGLYIESDKTKPLGKYGESKLLGEEAVIEETGDALILRLSWVYGEGTQNFIHKLIGWSETNEYLKVVCDEFSVPTYTYTIADVTLKALDEGLTGLYHLTNTGYCSRYEWAKQIFKCLGIEKFIRPVLMDSFELPAKRPGFSAMSNLKLSKKLGIEIPAWDESVSSFLGEFYRK